uniref:Uncharacterized protein n=1 Tax=Oryza brachyantha TaxID=4533 RepID=J3L4P9_ORYBR
MHHDSSSSPLKLPGPSVQQLVAPFLSTWLLCRWPRTMNSILCTGVQVEELTTSPLGNTRDLTLSQMFSSTRSSMCWNSGT